MGAPAIGHVEGGYRFIGGNHRDRNNWEQIAPVDVSAEWGAGARRLPNGTIERVGPRGGVTEISSGAADGGGVGKLTEDQGKSGGYARLMADAERSYEQALREGFNPTGIAAGIANFTDNIPFLGGVGNFIRSDAGDRARQAELQWTDAQLKAMSGAASPEQEVVRNQITNFARPGQNFDYLGDRLRQARTTAFEAAKIRAGKAASDVTYPAVAFQNKIDPTTGLPTYPEISAMTAGLQEFPLPDGGYGPQPGDVSVTTQPLAPEDTPASLAAQGYVYDAARDTWSRTTQVPVSGEDRQEYTPAGAVADRRDDWGVFRRPDAFMRGMADTASMEFADEAGGFANAAIGRGNGDSFGERFRNNIKVERALDAADGADMPMTRRAGQIAGGVVALPRILPKLLSRGLFNVGRNALAGGAMAAATAAGDTEGGAGERAQNALTAAPLGALVGAAAGPAVRALGRAASPAIDTARGLFGSAANAAARAAGRRGWEAIETTPLSRGLDHFAGTNRPDIQQMTARAAALQEATGRPATLIDAMNTGGRGVVRGVALRGDNARQLSEDFAAGRTEALPARISEQVRARVSGDLRTAQQITEETTQRRSALAREDYAEPYAAPVVVDDATVSALQGSTGRTAIQKARSDAEVWRQPEVVDDLNRLEEWAQAGFQGPRPQISAAALDGVHQAMTGRARRLTQNPNTNRAGAGLFNRADDVDNALDNVPGLEGARANYRELSGQIGAAETGSRFMGGNPDRVVAELQGLSPDQLNVARATAARSIENAAGTIGSAPSVARRLYIPNTPQYQASEALLGQEGARGLAAGLRGEMDLVRNAQRTSPAYGSNTNMDQQDTERAAQGALGALGAAARGRPLEAVSKLMDGLRSRGFNDAQAEAFIRAVQDDSQTTYLIAELSRRMTEREAVELVRATRYAVSGGIGRGNGG